MAIGPASVEDRVGRERRHRRRALLPNLQVRRIDAGIPPARGSAVAP
jgi:hypothetical protein